ncbi:MAG TPA: hypothetical protein VMR86_22455 [Myxococcota bacterium]|nr:hypothetical protein [Myxococcota bacterium]
MVRWQDLSERVNRDGEFRQAARSWDATLRLDMGSASHKLSFRNGSLVAAVPCAADAACDLFVGASEEQWRELLAPVPRPYYQDLFAAHTAHGVRLPENRIAYAAYYPALRRLVQILSALRVSQ